MLPALQRKIMTTCTVWMMLIISPGGGLFVGNLRTCASHYEIKLPIHEKFIKKNKCICTNNMLDSGFCVFILNFQI